MYIFKYIIRATQNNKILFENNDCKFHTYILFEIFLNTEENDDKYKYKLLIDTMDNMFLSDKIKDYYLNHFCKIQNIYFSLLKFKNQYKFKKYKILIDRDLLLNPISLKDKICFPLIQNKYKYLFTSNDIINLFYNSLTNSCDLFEEYLEIKNPYNNVAFTKSTLYNMYFFIKTKTISNIELIDKFFICNFDHKYFTKEYRYLIRDHIIKNYIKNTSNEQVKDYIEDMLEFFNDLNIKNLHINIHDDFPITELRIIMKDYLYLYMTYLYSLIEYKRKSAYNQLIHKLTKFRNYNPLFGRKYIKIQNFFCAKTGKLNKNIEINFNKKHVNFYDNSDKWLNNRNNVFYFVITNDSFNEITNNNNYQINDIDNLNRELYIWINENDNNYILRRNLERNNIIVNQNPNPYIVNHDTSSDDTISENIIDDLDENNEEKNESELDNEQYDDEFDEDYNDQN